MDNGNISGGEKLGLIKEQRDSSFLVISHLSFLFSNDNRFSISLVAGFVKPTACSSLVRMLAMH